MQWWLATLVTLTACGPAAADPTYDWSGFYTGAMTGYGWADGDFVAAEDGLRMTSSHNLDGGLFGAFAGYQNQFENRLVLGLEADIAHRSGSDSDIIRSNVLPESFAIQSYDANLDWTGSIRGRLGYAAGKWLPFVTAGLAWASYDVTHQNADYKIIDEPPLSIGYSESSVGWTAGAGFDFAATERIIGSVEYRYSDYGEADVPLYGWEIDSGYKLQTHDLLIGVGYRF